MKNSLILEFKALEEAAGAHPRLAAKAAELLPRVCGLDRGLTLPERVMDQMAMLRQEIDEVMGSRTA